MAVRKSKPVKPGKPAQGRAEPEREDTTRGGLADGWKRHAFVVREEHLDKLKAVAYQERRDVKAVLDDALAGYLKRKRTGRAT